MTLHGAYDEGTATAINGCPGCSVGDEVKGG
jgi:hypothetical protein